MHFNKQFVFIGGSVCTVDLSISKPEVNLPASDSHVQVGKDGSTLAEKQPINKQKELKLNVASQTVSAESSTRRSIDESNTRTISQTEHKTLLIIILSGLKVQKLGSHHNASFGGIFVN